MSKKTAKTNKKVSHKKSEKQKGTKAEEVKEEEAKEEKVKSDNTSAKKSTEKETTSKKQPSKEKSAEKKEDNKKEKESPKEKKSEEKKKEESKKEGVKDKSSEEKQDKKTEQKAVIRNKDEIEINLPDFKATKNTKVAAGVFAVAVLLGLVAAGGYYYVINSANYAYYKITTALEREDYATFEEYVDMDQAASGIVDDSLESSLRVYGEEDPRYEDLKNISDEEKETERENLKANLKSSIQNSQFIDPAERPQNLWEAFTQVDFQQEDGKLLVPMKTVGATGSQEIDVIFDKQDGKWVVTEFRLDFDKINEEAKQRQEEFQKQQEEAQTMEEVNPEGAEDTQTQDPSAQPQE
jgi:hypothetical protein